MEQKHIELTVLPIAVLFTAGLLWVAQSMKPPEKPVEIPDFASIKDVKVKKETFFHFMLPKVRETNDEVLAERGRLIPLLDALDDGNEIDSEDAAWLNDMATRYRVKGDPLASRATRALLRKRVDIIPASLALAQAANESAWGTARFARNGKNYFGMWCWVRNCGMIPTRREAEKKHEVASFDTIEAGVDYYVLTLNSHPAYRELRDRRLAARKGDRPVIGSDLAGGLVRYSERGEEYVKEIRAMIRVNNLQRFNREVPVTASLTPSQP